MPSTSRNRLDGANVETNRSGVIILDEEVKELRKGITDILVAIARLDEQMKTLATMSSQLQETVIKVAHLERDSKTIFTKYDEVVRRVDNVETSIHEERNSSKEDRKWLLGAVIGAVALGIQIFNAIGNGS